MINVFTGYHLYQGNITMDDVVAAIPEDDVVYKIVTSLKAPIIRRMVDYLSERHTFLNGTTKTVVVMTADDEQLHDGDIRYELFAPSRDADLIRPMFSGMRVRHPINILIDDGKTTLRSMFVDFIKTHWSRFPCDSDNIQEELKEEVKEEEREDILEDPDWEDAIMKKEEEEREMERNLLFYALPAAVLVAVLTLMGRRYYSSRRMTRRQRQYVDETDPEDASMLPEIADENKIT